MRGLLNHNNIRNATNSPNAPVIGQHYLGSPCRKRPEDRLIVAGILVRVVELVQRVRHTRVAFRHPV